MDATKANRMAEAIGAADTDSRVARIQVRHPDATSDRRAQQLAGDPRWTVEVWIRRPATGTLSLTIVDDAEAVADNVLSAAIAKADERANRTIRMTSAGLGY